jgi:hypothetical protein
VYLMQGVKHGVGPLHSRSSMKALSGSKEPPVEDPPHLSEADEPVNSGYGCAGLALAMLADSALTASRAAPPLRLQAFDRQVYDGLCDKQAAHRLELLEVVLGGVKADPAHPVCSGDDAQRADRNQTQVLRGSSHYEVIGQKNFDRTLRAEQEALALSCLKFA